MTFFNPKDKGCCHGNQSSECKKYFKYSDMGPILVVSELSPFKVNIEVVNQ
jgi:hypothetical protein